MESIQAYLQFVCVFACLLVFLLHHRLRLLRRIDFRRSANSSCVGFLIRTHLIPP